MSDGLSNDEIDQIFRRVDEFNNLFHSTCVVDIRQLGLKSLPKTSSNAYMSSNGYVIDDCAVLLEFKDGRFCSDTGNTRTSFVTTVIVIDNKCAILHTRTGSNYMMNLMCTEGSEFKFTNKDMEDQIVVIHVSGTVFSLAPPSIESSCAYFFLHPELFVVAHTMYVALLQEDKKMEPIDPKLAILQKICDPTSYKNADRGINRNKLASLQYLQRDVKNETLAVACVRNETLVDDSPACACLVAIKVDGSIGLILRQSDAKACFVVEI